MKKTVLTRVLSGILTASMLLGTMPVSAAENTAVVSAETAATDETPDYILGRPMTEEEIAEQQAIAAEALKTNGYIPMESSDVPETLAVDESSILARAVIPSFYDSREEGIETPVSDQSPYGTCWSFTAMTLLESSLLSKGYSYTNLSESHLAYFANFSAPEPLNNQYKDSMNNKNPLGYADMGGNNYLSYTTLSAWRGAAAETTAPYSKLEQGFSNTVSEAYGSTVAHLQGFYRIDASNKNMIKSAIMEHGAVGAGYYHEDIYCNYNTVAYFYPYGYATMNHAITIIGWDDHYSKENFWDGWRPSADGAWIVKNSWGTNWGNDGYFYISYEDETLGEFYVFDTETSDNYDHCYQYDLTSSLGGGYIPVRKAASVFHAKANNGKPEYLKAVSLGLTASVNVEYAIQIYKNPTDASNPSSGTPMLSKPQTGKTTLAGYYTIPLDRTLKLSAGDTFVVEFSFPNYTYVDCEYPYDDHNGYVVTASSKSRESYIYQYDEYGWYDLGREELGNLRMKAFTCDSRSQNNDGTGDIFTNDVYRIAGATRYQTSFSIADAFMESKSLDQFQNVIIACGRSFADALAGSYLAGKKQAPILMYNNKSGNSNVADLVSYIKENLAANGTVYLLGGKSAVGADVERALSNYHVKRLGGNTRYETNLLILEEAGIEDEEILVCTAQTFADSLSCSAADRPILLVNSKTNVLTEGQKQFLRSVAGNPIYVIGGESAVSSALETQLKNYGSVTRIGGKSRYETSVLIAETFFDQPNSAVFAYAKNFPDGLCGGPLASARNCPLILTASGKEADALSYTSNYQISEGIILGGSSLINDSVTVKLFRLNSKDQIKLW